MSIEDQQRIAELERELAGFMSELGEPNVVSAMVRLQELKRELAAMTAALTIIRDYYSGAGYIGGIAEDALNQQPEGGAKCELDSKSSTPEVAATADTGTSAQPTTAQTAAIDKADSNSAQTFKPDARIADEVQAEINRHHERVLMQLVAERDELRAELANYKYTVENTRAVKDGAVAARDKYRDELAALQEHHKLTHDNAVDRENALRKRMLELENMLEVWSPREALEKILAERNKLREALKLCGPMPASPDYDRVMKLRKEALGE